ncbi:hypothetical protein AAG906_018665 [Vitis piasezkii]|uniref:Nuclear transcription factor Y subunit B-7 n=1 Tax=Vitis vinifera TaxID=29760 RepID=A0A438DAD7_VITVI|nr:Nuclear transcription factor Y subunit B-7 [Vitis vinifera]
MEDDESHANAPTTTNPESPCLKSSSGSGSNSINKEQDRFLPIANVGRIMKSFVTGEASDKCQREKRKTINGEDIIWAITTLGFEDYVSPLKQYLSKYREIEGEKLNIPKQHRSEQRLQQQEQEQNLPYASVYSSTTLISQPPFVAADQPFPLPFSADSIQKQLHQQEHFDSGGRW